jgi:hypothetical protein
MTFSLLSIVSGILIVLIELLITERNKVGIATAAVRVNR